MAHAPDDYDFRRGEGAETISIAETAAFLNLHRSTVRSLITDGQIYGYRLAKQAWRVNKASVIRYREEQQAAPPDDDALQARLRDRRRQRTARVQGPQVIKQLTMFNDREETDGQPSPARAAQRPARAAAIQPGGPAPGRGRQAPGRRQR